MKTHVLKCDTEPFMATWAGKKNFEFRHTVDREYAVGDILELQEWESEDGTGYATGREIEVFVTYLLDTSRYSAQKDFCVMGFEVLSQSGG